MRKPRSKLNSFPRVTQLSVRARTWPHAGKLPLVADKLPQVSRLSLCPNAYGPRVPTYGPRVWIIPSGAEHVTGVQLHRCPSRLHMQLLQTPAQQLKDKDLAERARVRGAVVLHGLLWSGAADTVCVLPLLGRRANVGSGPVHWVVDGDQENMCRPYMTGSQHHRPPQMASKTMIKQG